MKPVKVFDEYGDETEIRVSSDNLIVVHFEHDASRMEYTVEQAKKVVDALLEAIKHLKEEK